MKSVICLSLLAWLLLAGSCPLARAQSIIGSNLGNNGDPSGRSLIEIDPVSGMAG